VPANQALSEGIDAIEAAARDGAEHEVFVRVAGAGDKIYLDLVNSAWTVVEIDATGLARNQQSAGALYYPPSGPAPTAGAEEEARISPGSASSRSW